jgi:hypothetical protein
VALLVLLAVSAAAEAARCAPCAFGGLCWVGDVSHECGPTEADCVPSRGILMWNAVAPNRPAYWLLRARRSAASGRLAGKLEVRADAGQPLPNVPGSPWRCRRGFCFGRSARFEGTVAGDGWSGVARHRDGATCEFRGTLRFGDGGAQPNSFTCRDAAAAVVSEGPFDVQGIRLVGCRP